MQPRLKRHRRILELIAREPLGTQDALRSALFKSGIEVNQATLSRDIRELGLVKIASKGEYRYVSRQASGQATTDMHETALANVKAFISAVEHAGNIVVVKTDDGAASHVASAMDGMKMPEVLGSVAGDNTLILIVKDGFKPAQVVRKIRSLIE
ncbi:MAG TPA: hypothetical protein V6C72_11315 [Chroococcales cyanobacterium]